MTDIVLSLSLGATASGCLAFYLWNRHLRQQLSNRRVRRAAEEVLGIPHLDEQQVSGEAHRGTRMRSV